MRELIEDLGSLMDGLLANQDLRERYAVDEQFRTFVYDTLRLYRECRNEVRASYGRAGVHYYNSILKSVAERLERLEHTR